ncbi:MAG: hypothetical protein JF597_38225 [Streptomyces sp.]|uniref:hypothetical protein n=1 Tax=Streptomyces sp. TaxID=1931 RepID=UPI0025FCFB76|nr:hypothetical protein [Streptomyces sp.]MBW8799198.1 hypothetical protein [Streptomyces sp.]
MERELLEAVAKFTEREGRGPTTEQAATMLKEETNDKNWNNKRVTSVACQLGPKMNKKLLTGGVHGVHDLSNLGRKMFGLPSGPPVGEIVRVGRLEKVFLEAVAKFTEREGRGPTTEQAATMLKEETNDDKWNNKRVARMAFRLGPKMNKKLLTGEVNGRHDLTTRGREMFRLPVGGGAGGDGVVGGLAGEGGLAGGGQPADGLVGSGRTGGQFGSLPAVGGVELGGGLFGFGGLDLVGGMEGMEGGVAGPEMSEFLWGGQDVLGLDVASEGVEVVLPPADVVGETAVSDRVPAGQLVTVGPGAGGQSDQPNAAGAGGLIVLRLLNGRVVKLTGNQREVLQTIGELAPEPHDEPPLEAAVAKRLNWNDGQRVNPTAQRLKSKELLTYSKKNRGYRLTADGREAFRQVAGAAGEVGGSQGVGAGRILEDGEVLQTIRDLTHRLGEAPTDEEIGKAVDRDWRFAAHRVKGLRSKGYLTGDQQLRFVLGLSKEGWVVIGRPRDAAGEPGGSTGSPLPSGSSDTGDDRSEPNDGQRQVLQKVWDLGQDLGRLPTRDEVCKAVDGMPRSSVHYHTQSLELMGLLRREYLPRELALTELGQKMTMEPTDAVGVSGVSPAARLKRRLTGTQLRVLTARHELTQQKRRLPRIPEIGDALNLAHPTVRENLRELQINKLLSRGLELTDNGLAVLSEPAGVAGWVAAASGLGVVLPPADAVGGSAASDGLAVVGRVFGGGTAGVEGGFLSGGWGEGNSEIFGGQFGRLPAVGGVELGGGLFAFGGLDLVGGMEGGVAGPEAGEFLWGGERMDVDDGGGESSEAGESMDADADADADAEGGGGGGVGAGNGGGQVMGGEGVAAQVRRGGSSRDSGQAGVWARRG